MFGLIGSINTWIPGSPFDTPYFVDKDCPCDEDALVVLFSDREFLPDIILRFSRYATGATDYYVLADAKRNTSKNPHNYIRASVQKAILYLELFKDLPGICSGGKHPQSPFGVTLLFYQPAPKVLGFPYSERQEIVNKFNQIIAGANQAPTPILSLDMSCIVDKECPSNNDVLAAWFSCVAYAERLLTQDK